MTTIQRRAVVTHWLGRFAASARHACALIGLSRSRWHHQTSRPRHDELRARLKTLAGLRPRFHVHFTPTYASWLNQVERWFGLITQQAIRGGSFRTVRELIARIDAYVARYNRTARLFVWTATADSILAKLTRLAKAINGTQH